jgi:CheY-like chemotaxis protein
MPNIKTLVVDGDRFSLSAASWVLATGRQIEVVAYATLWPEVLAKAGVWQPDLVLLDADLAGPDYENAVNDIKLRARETKVVLIARRNGATVPGAMVAKQADGCVELRRIAHQLPLLVQSLFGATQAQR